MADLSNYNIYTNKDGRMRAYNKETHAVTSYPRLIAELKIGRPLVKGEDVHHLDGNPLNNDPDNLIVLSHSEHEHLHGGSNRKYFNKEMICPICGKAFIWTPQQQSLSSTKGKAGPFCSRHCRGIYGTNIQNNRPPFSNR